MAVTLHCRASRENFQETIAMDTSCRGWEEHRPVAPKNSMAKDPKPTKHRKKKNKPKDSVQNVIETTIKYILQKLVESGASTVAIDNKIEQAMDLVKSHLMFAVREEVEVLKERIKELCEQNKQLEIENQILKNAATPETLANLNSNKQQTPPS